MSRSDRFDRGDFAARQPLLRPSPAMELQPTLRPASFVRPELAPEAPSAAALGPLSTLAASAGLPPGGETRVTADYLSSLGWLPATIQKILNGPEVEDTSAAESKTAAPTPQVEAYLRSLGWSPSDIARLLVGPEKARLTAESLFRQHAANSGADQTALLSAFVHAGAASVKRDPSLLEGLNPKHLAPEAPSDLAQIIAQFAELPEVQKQRFLLLLDEQKLSKDAPKATPGTPPAKISGGAGSDTAKGTSSAGDVLPVVKSSLDLLSTALKGLLGTTQGGSKERASGAGKGSAGMNPTRHKSDAEDPSDAEDSSGSDDPSDSDESSGSDDTSSSEDHDNPSADSEARSEEDPSPDEVYGPPFLKEAPQSSDSEREPD